VFRKPDGSLEKLVEKPDLNGRQLANTGAYVFPSEVFDTELKVSTRGEYEITDYVTALAARRKVDVVQTRFWLPIGTVEAWEAAQSMDLASVLTARK
jgi:dTDP-glucose pyrophosphorylase